MNTINLGFEKDFAKYSIHDFIEDLIESHDIKDFEGESKSLYQFDHKHEKAIHFYEQIILLGQGEITTSLIKLLVLNDPFENILQEVEPGESDDYDKFV
jgi:aminopeptidase C